MAKLYDCIMRDAEEKGLRDWRQQLLHDISGDVLELGCGTGANLEFYPETVKRLVLAEPSAPMRKKVQAKILRDKQLTVQLLHDHAEQLSLPAASFDAVVCTLVLCSVKNLEKTLAEIHRVLKPSGQLFFIEHVAASHHTKRYIWQCRFAFLWQLIAGGCHITRHTEDAIIQAGFKVITIERQSMRGVPKIVRPSIRGVAIKNVGAS
jgi:ubiquinone/menaquinone biosynthesis C-methylase UbiE